MDINRGSTPYNSEVLCNRHLVIAKSNAIYGVVACSSNLEIFWYHKKHMIPME